MRSRAQLQEERGGVRRSPRGRLPWDSPTGARSRRRSGSPLASSLFAFQSVCFFLLPDVYFKHHTLRAYKED